MNGPLVFRKDLIVSLHEEGNGQKSIVIKNPVTDQFYYMSMREYVLLKKFEDQVDLEKAILMLREEGYYYDAKEAALILEKASNLGLMLGTHSSKADPLHFLKKKHQKLKRAGSLMAPLFLYIPLINPDSFLNRTLFMVTLLFNRKTIPLWAAVFLGSLYLVMVNVGRIGSEYIAFLSVRDLLTIMPVIALTRLVHELGHAYAAKAFGLEVKALGLALLVLFPCPYIDTTDAWKLPRRRERMIISAAGMLAEIILASICVFIWFFSKPGILNYLSFYIMTISTVSTLAFNANPLMRFDGYFMLSDYLRLPNLAQRSFQYIKAFVMSKFLGVSLYPIPEVGLRQSLIFVIYGTSALFYRTSLYGAIIAGLYYRFDKLLGLMLATYASLMFVARPIIRGMREIWGNRNLIRSRGKTLLCLGTACGFIAAALVCPWPQSAKFPCRVDSQDTRAITIPVNSIVKDVFIREGHRLVKGQTMFELDTTVLEFELRKVRLEKEIFELQIKTLTLDKGDLAKVPQKSLELSVIDEAILRMERDLRGCVESVKAPFDGVVTRLDRRLKPGFQPSETTVVGYIKSTSSPVAVVSIPDSFLGKIFDGQAVEVQVPWGEGRVFSTTLHLTIPCPEFPQSHTMIASSRSYRRLKDMPQNDPVKTLAGNDSDYVWSAQLPGGEDLPVGMTGIVITELPPQSLSSRIYGYVVQTSNRESFF